MSKDHLIKLFSVSINEKAKDLATKYKYRPYMIQRYYHMFGSWNEVIELLVSFESKLLPSIRCNTLKIKECEYLLKRLKSLNYDFIKISWEPNSFRVIKFGQPSLGATHEFLLGLYYLYRGAASLIPPVILNPRRNDVVLDMAAAPGGKTTHLSQLMGNKGVIVAVDINRQRMRSLRSNLERMGIINVLSIRMDARLIPKVFGSNYFDKILLDAPCTAEGLIQIDPERKTKTSIRDIVKAHMLQAELLNAAVDAVKPGGHVLYVTCSIAPEENEFTVSKVISSRNDVRIEHLPNIVKFVPGLTEFHSLPLHPDVRKCGRLYPHIHDMEGYFICLLKKVI